ncbi:MAG TPA: hypothetical protein VJ783_09645 [Pirellulales bacterium]|nr:hypothetical protein [Pirellulales bacterium]
MTINEIRKFYKMQPFRPFVIHMADGQAIPVKSPEFMASAPNGRTVTVYQPDSTWDFIDLLLVTRLEIMPGRNGARRRKQ